MHTYVLRSGAQGFAGAIFRTLTEDQAHEVVAAYRAAHPDLADIARSFAEANPQRRFTMLPLPADLHRVDELVPQAPKGVL